jgi:hypothetical protein
MHSENKLIELIDLLSQHRSRANGITCAQVSAKLKLRERKVRELVTEARFSAVALCGTPEAGYFIADTPEELDETTAFLQHRAMKSLKVVALMRGTTLSELCGQLQLVDNLKVN